MGFLGVLRYMYRKIRWFLINCWFFWIKIKSVDIVWFENDLEDIYVKVVDKNFFLVLLVCIGLNNKNDSFYEYW